MDADVERFLEESRTFFTPEECDAAERVLRGWYEKANDSPEWQERWDRLREAISPPSKPIQEKLTKLEVEGGERLAGGQPRLGEMPFDAAPTTVGHFVLGERRKEAGRRPAFLVGLLRELGPHQLEGRQAQLAQQELDAGGINSVGRRHATTSRLEVGRTA
jgi:hypothetical protein